MITSKVLDVVRDILLAFIIYVLMFPYHMKQKWANNNVSYPVTLLLFVVVVEAHSQGVSRERSFGHGSVLRILPSIMAQPAIPSTTAQQCGLSEAPDSMSGRRIVRYCGSVAIVRNSCWIRLSAVCVNCFRFQRARERVYSGTWGIVQFSNGKLIVMLSSAVVEDVKHMRESRSVLVAYYYFDFKDAAKRDVRGLLASLLLQLVDDSDRCLDVLSQLHKTCRDGSDLPSEASLAKCLKNMLLLPGRCPVYFIIDALDECPNATGTSSAREKVLDVLDDLIRMDSPNLSICITSRPEHDITTVLDLLTPSSCRVSLHEEVGQREDINGYVLYFVQNDKAMRRWRAEDKELVINVLSERAGGM